jgi:hypothetical protein
MRGSIFTGSVHMNRCRGGLWAAGPRMGASWATSDRDHCLPVSPTRAMITSRSDRSAGLRLSLPSDLRVARVDVPPATHVVRAGELAWPGTAD